MPDNDESKRKLVHETTHQAEACGGRDWAKIFFWDEMKATPFVETIAIFRPLLAYPALVSIETQFIASNVAQ